MANKKGWHVDIYDIGKGDKSLGNIGIYKTKAEAFKVAQDKRKEFQNNGKKGYKKGSEFDIRVQPEGLFDFFDKEFNTTYFKVKVKK